MGHATGGHSGDHACGSARHEKENLRLVTAWDQEGIDANVADGMEHNDFAPEVKAAIRQAALDRIVPNWVARAGEPDSEAVKLFNEKVAPIVGVQVTADGKAEEIGMATAQPD